MARELEAIEGLRDAQRTLQHTSAVLRDGGQGLTGPFRYTLTAIARIADAIWELESFGAAARTADPQPPVISAQIAHQETRKALNREHLARGGGGASSRNIR